MSDIKKYSFGMVGLGTMGSNLVLNMRDKGYTVAGYDKDPTKLENLLKQDDTGKINSFGNINDFINALETPRTILFLVPAGPIVDAVIADLKPLLGNDDILIDCGNSHYTDTQKRVDSLIKDGIHFMGLGVSGGELGARFGPSIMPGGDEFAYNRVAKMLEDISAKVAGTPCTAYMGHGAAGHYVKMVHNGIEYALMQLISEAYHIMKVYAGMSNAEISETFTNWNNGRLNSFLVQISAAVLKQKDENTEKDLIDMIADTAGQKGTGAWTSQDAMSILAPVPSIDSAVTQRIISSLKDSRIKASAAIGRQQSISSISDKTNFLGTIEKATYSSFVIVYAQGLSLLRKASDVYKFETDISKVSVIWRGGCIIRAAILADIAKAYETDKNIENIMLSTNFINTLKEGEEALKILLTNSINASIPTACFSSTLNYYLSYTSHWLPANMIQAQRDFFGAHTYQRIDKTGSFHTVWNEKIQ